MKIYFLLWEGLPCDETGFITARMDGSAFIWFDEDHTAMWDTKAEAIEVKKKFRSNTSYSVYEVEI